MPKKQLNQTQRILNHLLKGSRITQVEAFRRFQCWRLASRIAELRNEGHDIITNTIKRNGKQYAQYQMKQYTNQTK